jgi:hypothetical protein
LVRWTHPEMRILGIIGQWPAVWENQDDSVYIVWLDKGSFNGPYPAVHKYLELVSASR